MCDDCVGHKIKICTLAGAFLALSLLTVGINRASEQAKPLDEDHGKPPREQRKALDEYTSALTPHLPVEPLGAVHKKNYIDDYIFDKMAQDHIPHAGLSSDTEFLRRVTLDLTGRIPQIEDIRKFVADKNPDKRDKLIDSLVATPTKGLREELTTPFLDHWSYWFGDLFRNNDGHLARGREIFYDYVYSALLENLPYDEFVREMLTATSRSNWTNGPVNYLARDYVNETDDSIINNEDTYDTWAISAYRVFLGINMECVSCHGGDGHLEKINLWLAKRKRQDLWSQASFFANSRLWRPYGDYSQFALTNDGKGYDLTRKSVVRPPRYAAQIAPAFLLNGEKPRTGEDLREAYARILTSSPQFAKATVNLVWAELMGVGIVDPPFAFDLDRQDPRDPPPAPWTIQPSHPELLEAMGRDFQAHNYDLRYLITLITKSSAYQLSSRFDGQWRDQYGRYFARHCVRRLSAPEVWDAIAQSTGVYFEIPVRRSSRKVKYMGQMLDPEDLSQPDVKPLADFAANFGLNNRFNVGDDSGGRKGSIIQASTLLNDPLILDRVHSQKGTRLYGLLNQEPPLTNSQVVDEMFLATLSRFPSTAEKEKAVGLLQEYRTQGAEDLLWALINKPEFIADH